MIQPAVDKARKDDAKATGKELINLAVKENVFNTMSLLLTESPGLRELIKAGKLKVEGAVRDLHSGKITWLGSSPDEKKLVGADSPKQK
jgi:carbonic anhydrase